MVISLTPLIKLEIVILRGMLNMFEKKIQDFSSNVAIHFKNELNVHKNMSTLFLKTGQYVVF